MALHRHKKSKAGIPAQRTLRYLLAHNGPEDSHYIDLAKDLSAINRRLYRQCRNYKVQSCSIVGVNVDDVVIRYCTAPNTWVVHSALKKAHALWDRMNKEAAAAAGPSANIAATWSDFKVSLTRDHQTDGDILVPIDNGGNAVSFGDWQYSEYVSPDGTAAEDRYLAYILGANLGGAGSRTAVGLVEGYQNSRARVQSDSPSISPTEFEDSWMMNLFDVGTHFDEVLNDLIDFNDAPPYDFDDMAGGAANMVKPLIQTQSFASSERKIGTSGAFMAPCGLIEIETTAADNSGFDLLVTVAPGNYKGVSADAF